MCAVENQSSDSGLFGHLWEAKPNFPTQADFPGISAVRAISFPEFALLALPRSRNGGEGALRHSDSSSRPFAVSFLVCSVRTIPDSKTLENHLKLVSCFVILHFSWYLIWGLIQTEWMIMLNTSLLCRPARPAGFIHFDYFCWAFPVSWVYLRCTCDYYKNSFYSTIAQWNNLPPEIIASTSPCSFGQSLGNLTLYILISNFMLWFFHCCIFLKQSVKSED